MPSKKPAATKATARTAAAKPAASKRPSARATTARTATRKAEPAIRTSDASSIRPLTHEEIAMRAHDLYVQSGFQGHREVEFWLEAERQLKGSHKL